MPKHWGLQYQARMEAFTKWFIDSRLQLNDLLYEKEQAEKKAKAAQEQYWQASSETSKRERAIHVLMDIGPSGLAKIEGESGPEMTIEQFYESITKKPDA